MTLLFSYLIYLELFAKEVQQTLILQLPQLIYHQE